MCSTFTDYSESNIAHQIIEWPKLSFSKNPVAKFFLFFDGIKSVALVASIY